MYVKDTLGGRKEETESFLDLQHVTMLKWIFLDLQNISNNECFTMEHQKPMVNGAQPKTPHHKNWDNPNS